MSGLTEVIEQSENNEDDQTSENLGTVADYFSKVATFFTESGVVVNIIVSKRVAI